MNLVGKIQSQIYIYNIMKKKSQNLSNVYMGWDDTHNDQNFVKELQW